MTLRKWRKETALTNAAQKLKSNKTFVQMMEVLRNELPTNQTLPVSGAGAHDFSYAYGVEVGYRRAIMVMEAMAVDAPELGQPEAKFEQQ
jgi:hypothetical protein